MIHWHELVDEALIFGKGGGGNELTSWMKLEIKSWHKFIYIMEWSLEIRDTRIKFLNIYGLSVNYYIFEILPPKSQIMQMYWSNSIYTTIMHLNSKKMLITGFYASIKYFKCFLNDFIFLPNLFQNNQVLVQISMQNEFGVKSKE